MTRAADWSGRVGEAWAQEWRRTDRAFAGLASHLNEAILAAAPAGPFTALDIGCGAGATSIALATAPPDASVVGVDLSAELVGVARQRAAGLANCRIEQGDAVLLAAASRPDLLVSRHGVMFFPDPQAAFVALRHAATPAARLIFTCFAAIADNPWATLITDLPAQLTGYTPGPFAFADPEQTRALLAGAGWAGDECRIDFAYRAGAGDDPVSDALMLLDRIGPAATLLRDVPPDIHLGLLAALRSRLERQRVGSAVDFPAAAWLWSCFATAGEQP